MAGFMDMLGKRPEGESAAAYQKTVLREIARKLTELEEQNDQNAAAIDEIKRLQKMMLQKVDAINVGADEMSCQPEQAAPAAAAEVEALQRQVEALSAKLAEDCQMLENRLDTMKLSIEDTVHKENIKCYRNVQGAIEEQGDVKEYDVKSLKKYIKVVVWFQLITIVLLVLRILGLL